MTAAKTPQNTRRVTIGFSPCPNDTFIFYGLMHGHVPMRGVEPAPAILADVESLNAWALEGRLDVTKLSFHALGHVLDEYVMLQAGSALGFGCGPLVVAARDIQHHQLRDLKVAIPGRFTTAAALLRQFAPQCRRLIVMQFDAIMPAIVRGEVDCGVIIHESRFTYKHEGLRLIVDLGAWWEEETGCAIPLGCIAARRSLGTDVIRELEKGIRASVRWARLHQEATMPYVREYAQEMEEAVLHNHISLYVNAFTEDIGAEGLAAVETFLERGRQHGLFHLPSHSLIQV
jgi:1,4-dihydroxy-6-naphthoate synthase